MTRPDRVVVVGASLAGLRAAAELRVAGHEGSITVIGDEAHAPYDRPPLSKAVLSGAKEPETTVLRSNPPVDDLDAEWRTGVTATSLDLAGRSVALDSGEVVPFDGLVIATGARPNRLPFGHGFTGVHTLRTLDDCLAIRDELTAGSPKVAVVGAGFIGAEVAATVRTMGLDVTMIDPLSTPLERAVGSQIGDICARLHQDHGVDLRLGVGVSGMRGTGRVEQVELADDTVVDADVVVVGIGVRPNTEWLDGSGLEIDDGVVCDATCLAAPGVVAAGDVARWPNQRFGWKMARLEHWDHAVQMGQAAARRLLATEDEATRFAPVPWFWSDQYDVKIQLAGTTSDADTAHTFGSVDDGKFGIVYGHAGQLIGGLGWNRPRDAVRIQMMIEGDAPFRRGGRSLRLSGPERKDPSGRNSRPIRLAQA